VEFIFLIAKISSRGEGLMKKTLLIAVLMLSVIGVSQFLDAANACHKTAYLISTGDGDMRIEVGEKIVWQLVIMIHNDPALYGTSPYIDVVVTDNLGAELQIDDYYATRGDVSWYTTGKSEKVHLEWTVNQLPVNWYAYLYLTVSTDLNPAGRQEYTSPGCYELNSGPTMKFMVDGSQQSIEMNSIMIEVLMPD
jgi:hypothetical protein